MGHYFTSNYILRAPENIINDCVMTKICLNVRYSAFLKDYPEIKLGVLNLEKSSTQPEYIS